MLGQVGRSLKIAQNAGQELDLKTRLENEMVVFSRLHRPPKNGQGVRPSWQNGLRFRNSLIGGLHMSTMIREQDGFITIYDHYSRRLMMIELYGLQKKISRETWPDAASAKEAFYAGEFTWDESGA